MAFHPVRQQAAVIEEFRILLAVSGVAPMIPPGVRLPAHAEVSGTQRPSSVR